MPTPPAKKRRPSGLQPGEVALQPVHANAGLEQRYRRLLERHIDRMQESVVYWLTAAYRANEPEIAADESPAVALRKAMGALTRRWTREFAKLAEQYGERFVRDVGRHTDASFAAQLRKAGFTVRPNRSRAVNDVMQASIGENVSLIRSIASEHLTDIEGAVMRSVQQGRDLGTLTAELQDRYGVTRRRAAFIARDQNNKATAAIARARQEQLGVVEGIWMHSAGGKKPRPSHVAMNGKRFKISEGMWDPAVGRYVFPGEEPNCRCVSRAVIPGFG